MAEAPPGARARPLSPYTTIWRWHVTMAASILNRVAGVALYLGLLIVAGWALALASGPDAYGAYTGPGLLGSLVGRVVLFGITVALFFHMANGVRHFAWDLGRGFAPKTADATAWGSFAFAIVAGVALWSIVLTKGVV